MLPASRFVRHVVVAKNALFTGRLVVDRRSVVLPTTCICIRYFQSEAAFHKIADHTLHTIQDAVEELLDSQEENDDYDVGNASGVLNIRIYPHGTWCINKQTPNRQIWWSSPLSGPKRFEYDEKDKLWISTKDGLNLGHSLSEELHHIFPQLKKMQLKV